MAIVNNRPSGGGSGGTVTESAREFFEVRNTNALLTSSQQYVSIISDTASCEITLPPITSINDGHFVLFYREEGTNAQVIRSDDALVELADMFYVDPSLLVPLNGDSSDLSANLATFTDSPDITYPSDTFNGQSIQVMEVPPTATGTSGLTSNFSPVTGSEARTVYFQFRYNNTGFPQDRAGFFSIGDNNNTGRLYALETLGTSGDLRLHIQNALVSYNAADLPNIYDGNVHTIVVTSSSENLNSVNLYIDDFINPIPQGGIVGTGTINTAPTGTTIGYSNSLGRCVTGRYSNFRVYDSVLSSDEINLLNSQGVLSVAAITPLDENTEIRFVYDQASNSWTPVDGVFLRLLSDNIRITALEGVASGIVQNGFGDYNDTATTITPINLVGNTWTTVTNNGNGAFTNLLYLPTRATRLMDTSTGRFLFDELDLGDQVFIRNDIVVNPLTNNSLLEARYVLGTGPDEYVLTSLVARLDAGSGVDYRFNLGPDFIYIGDTNTRDNPVTLQIRLSTEGTLVNNGSAIGVTKRGG